jgi:hypothetical protein
MTTKLRARFDGKNLVPLGPVDLPNGLVVEVEIHPAEQAASDSARRILEALRSLPKLDPDVMDEFDAILKAERIPAPDSGGLFDDLADA